MADLLLPQPKDAVHKAWLYRLLTGIYNDVFLADQLYFKGGTYAAMLGYIDRFSIDLDFFLREIKVLFRRRENISNKYFTNSGFELETKAG